MKMVAGLIEMCRAVTGRAEIVAFGAQTLAMRFMAITAGHTRRVHLALGEGRTDENFLLLLPVRVIERIA